MNIHNHSQRKAVAFLIVIGLIFCLYLYFKITDKPEQKTVGQPIPIPVQPIAQIAPESPIKTPIKEPIDFEGIEAKRGDVYGNRGLLISKIKSLDPSADFSDNYDEGSDEADDNFEAPDKYGSDFQIVGSKKHIKEVNYTYRANPYFPNSKTFEYNVIVKTGKILCKLDGENFTKLYLAAIEADPKHAFKDSAIVGDKKMVIEYETQNNSINFVVTHK